jgi:hypothetical protein
VLTIASLVGLVAGVALAGVSYVISEAIPEVEGRPGVLLAAAVAAAAVLLSVILFRDRLFPAVEIANVTPGRRIFHRLTRASAPAR